MKEFTNAIRKAVITQNWFGALFLSLCIPDICASIETPDESNGVRYKRWFNDNFKKFVPGFSADDAWYFRCSCLHQGIDTDTRMTYGRIHFITPPPRHNIVHCNNLGGVLQMQIDVFCSDMADVVDSWYRNISSKDQDMELRVQGLIKIYGPESLKPYVSFGKE